MHIKNTYLDGIYEIENNIFTDYRGVFVKNFHDEIFKKHGLNTEFKESFYSVSKQNVLRGMHFQLPPHDHEKLIYVTHGQILDVVVDIRKESHTFGRYFEIELSAENARSLYVSKGYAHGFLTLSPSATVTYLTTTVHAPEHDTGIHWNSFSYNWMGITSPIVSNRDALFPDLNTFRPIE